MYICLYIHIHVDIKEGDELTINYLGRSSISEHNESKKLHKFKCSCSDKFIITNSDRAVKQAKIIINWRQNNLDLIPQMVEDYLRSEIGKVVAQKRRKIDVSDYLI